MQWPQWGQEEALLSVEGLQAASAPEEWLSVRSHQSWWREGPRNRGAGRSGSEVVAGVQAKEAKAERCASQQQWMGRRGPRWWRGSQEERKCSGGGGAGSPAVGRLVWGIYATPLLFLVSCCCLPLALPPPLRLLRAGSTFSSPLSAPFPGSWETRISRAGDGPRFPAWT